MSKIACISGCSRGLGRAMAQEFSARGWKIAGGARNIKELESLKSLLQTDHLLHPFDITISEEVDSFSRLVEKKLGIPDLLINNAGLINRNAPLTEISSKEFASVIAVNLGGIHNMIRSFVPLMERIEKGIIVNFSSYWGQSSAADVGPYCASKWGVEGLTRSLSQELPNNLGAVAFNPGIVNTDMLRSTFGKEAENYESPDQWAKHAVSKLEELSLKDSGKTIIG